MDTLVAAAVDRRLSARRRAADWDGLMRVRVRPGHDASLIDWSADGAAIQTAHRLLPGSVVELQFDSERGRTCARGRVLRCAVVKLEATRITYGGAVCFERPLSMREA
jgi:hypothetical protein